MRILFVVCVGLGCLLLSASGCALCEVGDLCGYSAVGGKWQRTNPDCGRVGSTLSDAGGYPVASASAVGAPLTHQYESQPIPEPYFHGSEAPLELMPEESASYPEGVILLGDEGH